MLSLSVKTLLFVFLSLSLIECKLTVRKPEELSNLFDKLNGIDYTILTPQNKITFQHKFVANLMLPNNSNACEALPLISSADELYISNPVILATWGDCHYAQKVQNAQAAGAKMMILILQHDMPLNHPTVRPLELDTSIQVLAISQKDGAKLIDYFQNQLKKNKDKSPYDIVVEIRYSYDETKYVNYQAGEVAKIDYWFVAGDETKNSYELLYDLEDLINSFGDKITFTPHYVLWKNENLGYENFNYDDDRCVSGGRYCDPEPMNGYKLYGAVSVIEDLRQICFAKLDDGKITPASWWWKYTKQFGTLCVDRDMDKLDTCRQDVYNQISLPQSLRNNVDNCMRDSFNVKDTSTNLTKVRVQNALLQAELEYSERHFGDFYPALYVNDDKYQDSFRNTLSIQDFICSHLDSKVQPNFCNVQLDTSKGGSDFALYSLIVVVSILIMAIMLYCVRRTVKRQVMGRMNEEISHIVTQYKQFKDKSTAGDDDL